ncbi:MAG TPA: hypothetical protein VF556_16135 [Pyrinomonadaceae bacterium]|jgi:hypothetical protein
MLIDEFMPVYDFSEKHETTVLAAAETAYDALNSFDFNESIIIHWLFRLRGLALKNSRGATSQKMTLRDMSKFDFVLLEENPNEEILFGLIGKFWKPTGDLQRVNAKDFLCFDKGGYAKTTWNFTLIDSAPQKVCLKTETRVLCMDEESRRNFQFYWTFIKPFSGWIRREALRLAKQKAEAIS